MIGEEHIIEKFKFQLPFGGGITKALLIKLEPTLAKIREHALERARLNAPIDDGEFRESLFVESALEGKDIIFYFGSSAPIGQTMFLHESEYQLGPTSEIQVGTFEGGVGKKFFTRVAEYWAMYYTDMIIDALLDIYEESFSSSDR